MFKPNEQFLLILFYRLHLGDMLVLGRMNAFNGAYEIMKDALQNNEQVIIESHAENDIPIEKITFENISDLENWYNQITYRNKQ